MAYVPVRGKSSCPCGRFNTILWKIRHVFFILLRRRWEYGQCGNHIYRDQKATMLIKILGLFTVSDAKGWQMDQGETVTVFNDMCFMAPASLIDKRIEWKEIDEESVSARFTNGRHFYYRYAFLQREGRACEFYQQRQV